ESGLRSGLALRSGQRKGEVILSSQLRSAKQKRPSRSLIARKQFRDLVGESLACLPDLDSGGRSGVLRVIVRHLGSKVAKHLANDRDLKLAVQVRLLLADL